jgi:hypothetical protein
MEPCPSSSRTAAVRAPPGFARSSGHPFMPPCPRAGSCAVSLLPSYWTQGMSPGMSVLGGQWAKAPRNDTMQAKQTVGTHKDLLAGAATAQHGRQQSTAGRGLWAPGKANKALLITLHQAAAGCLAAGAPRCPGVGTRLLVLVPVAPPTAPRSWVWHPRWPSGAAQRLSWHRASQQAGRVPGRVPGPAPRAPAGAGQAGCAREEASRRVRWEGCQRWRGPGGCAGLQGTDWHAGGVPRGGLTRGRLTRGGGGAHGHRGGGSVPAARCPAPCY